MDQQRIIALEGCLNLRDLGGYPTTDGGLTRWGRVLRGGNGGALPPASLAALRRQGIRTIIDLRWAGERAEAPSALAAEAAFAYRAVPFYGDQDPYALAYPGALGAVYRLELERQRAPISAILRSLLEPGTPPLIFHCAFGKDRTGVIAALLLGLAGVPRQWIVADYALTAETLGTTLAELRAQATPEELAAEGFWLDCRAEDMESLLDYLDEEHGGAAGYVRALGLAEGEIAALRGLLREPG
ncbi:MAG TPA: tyrosine-protein phosphatase [Herpetosiphonaceae bacterium]